MGFRLKYGMKYGTVLVTDDCQGVAIFIEGYYAKFGFTTVNESFIPGTGIPHIAMVKAGS